MSCSAEQRGETQHLARRKQPGFRCRQPWNVLDEVLSCIGPSDDSAIAKFIADSVVLKAVWGRCELGGSHVISFAYPTTSHISRTHLMHLRQHVRDVTKPWQS